MYGRVCGPMASSMPSLIALLPARPTPTIRPSLIPMSALTQPRTGSSTSTPAMTASSSDGPAEPCVIRCRIVLA